MDLAEKIKQLQNKSKAYKVRVLAVSMTVIMILIVSLWVATLKNTFNTAEKNSVESTASPIKIVSEIFGDGLKDFRKKIGDSKELFR